MKRTLIHNATIVNEGQSVKGSVVIEDGRIAEVLTNWKPLSAPCDETIDATGCYLLPGIIDDHVHFRDPGLTHKADILTESRAAAAGGVTSIMDMPNTNPVTTTLDALNAKLDLLNEKCIVNHSCYFGATNDNNSEFGKLDKHRVCGIKLFMGSSTGNMLVDKMNSLLNIFNGTDITGSAPHRVAQLGIGRTFQNIRRFSNLSVLSNVVIASNLDATYNMADAIFETKKYREREKHLEEKAMDLLEVVGLADKANEQANSLPYGHQRKLEIARAMALDPKLLLLDEHTAALDPATAEKVLALTKSIVAEKKITCLMVTHNMHQALELGNRTLMMDAGRIVFDVKGAARSKMTVDDLLEKFRENAGKNLDNDRILLSKVEK